MWIWIAKLYDIFSQGGIDSTRYEIQLPIMEWMLLADEVRQRGTYSSEVSSDAVLRIYGFRVSYNAEIGRPRIKEV